jgi:hypothetical protein
MGKPPAFFYTLTFTLEFQHDNDTVCAALLSRCWLNARTVPNHAAGF